MSVNRPAAAAGAGVGHRRPLVWLAAIGAACAVAGPVLLSPFGTVLLGRKSEFCNRSFVDGSPPTQSTGRLVLYRSRTLGPLNAACGGLMSQSPRGRCPTPMQRVRDDFALQNCCSSEAKHGRTLAN